MWGICIKYLYWSVSYDKSPHYFRCHLRHFYCLDKHPWKAIPEDWAQCWLDVLLWTPGGAEYHVAETAPLLVVRKQRGRDKIGSGPLGILQRNAQCLCFSHQASISTGIFKCLFNFESNKGLNFWLGHCPHGLIISGNALADRARGLWHSSPRLLSIQSKFSERDIYVCASPADISQVLLVPSPHCPFWRQNFSLTWDLTWGWASWLCT